MSGFQVAGFEAVSRAVVNILKSGSSHNFGSHFSLQLSSEELISRFEIRRF